MHSYNNGMLLKAMTLPVIIILLAAGCYYDKGELIYPDTADCSKVNATYTAVKAILTTKCNTAGCHNTASAAGSIVLETYDQAKAQAGRIKQRAIVDKTMPPGSPLTASDISLLTCWINSGTPNN
ncbi:hypothetical protein FAM09_13785 [Niastella caeni]|uniref:Cytochrome c domain-containing protein n=1 Tax=Niastella caeni TaxID=2569763 RepID=A0A4S8HVX8_9BACT|nr:hypothetical protein FAM09_13785 [Niastella caeni]